MASKKEKIVRGQLTLFNERIELPSWLFLSTTDKDKFMEISKQIFSSKLVSIDIETFSDDPNTKEALFYWRNNIRLISISNSKYTCILDLGSYWDNRAVIHKQSKKWLSLLKKCCENPNIAKVLVNASFDCGNLLYHYGINTVNIKDLMIISQVRYAGIIGYRHGFKGLMATHLGIDVDKTEQKSDWGDRLTDSQLLYSAQDSKYLIECYYKLTSKVTNHVCLNVAKVEAQATEVFYRLNTNGFPVNKEYIENSITEYQEVLKRLDGEVYNNLGIRATGDPKKMKAVLESVINKQSLESSWGELFRQECKEGLIVLEDTTQSTLEDYLHIPEIECLSDYRSLKKNLDYFQGLLASYRDGCAYGQYVQLARVGSGRSSCRAWDKGIGVNLQNPAKDNYLLEKYKLPSLKKAFQAPPGYKLVVYDLSAAHLRLAAQITKDPEMINEFALGLDAHLNLVSKFPVEVSGFSYSYETLEAIRKHGNNKKLLSIDELRKIVNLHGLAFTDSKGLEDYLTFEIMEIFKCINLLRDLSKTVRYLSLNGGGKLRLYGVLNAGKARGSVSLELSEQLINQFRTVYNVWWSFVKGMGEKCKYPHTSINKYPYAYWYDPLGRVFHIPFFKDLLTGEWKFPLTKAVSYNWLGAEAYWIKKSAYLIQEEIKELQLDARLVELTHDELGCLVREDHALQVGAIMQNTCYTVGKELIKEFEPLPLESPSKFICENWSEK